MSECTPCKALDCNLQDDYNLYSLQREIYPVVVPYKMNVGGATISLKCCDGTIISKYVRQGLSNESFRLLFISMVNECVLKGPFCAPALVNCETNKTCPTNTQDEENVDVDQWIPVDPIESLSTISDVPDGSGLTGGGGSNQTIIPETPPTQPPVEIFYNTRQEKTVYCPDGNPFKYYVPAAKYAAESQAEADAAALADAEANARDHRICLSEIADPYCCKDKSNSITITATGNYVSGATWAVSKGSLPDGLTLSGSGSTAVISGTPTTVEQATFTIQVKGNDGSLMTKEYTLDVIELLPKDDYTTDFDVGVYTSQQFTVDSQYGDVTATWSYTGDLPAGMTFTSAGLLSGTPTTALGYSFTIVATIN